MDNMTVNKGGGQKGLIMALLAVAGILVILVGIDILRKKPAPIQNTDQPAAPQEQTTDIEEIVTMPQEQKDQFREDVPADIVVPDTGTQLTEEQKREIAVPTVVVPAAPGVASSFRDFDIRAEGGAYIPTKVIAKLNDTVHIDFTAVDGDYDIVFPSNNMMTVAKKGQTSLLEFRAEQSGSFTYYCSSCGGPEKGPKGNIIIVE